MIGTRGVPARYGGFETCVEEVGRRLVELGHEVVVFCRGDKGDDQPAEYLGMELVRLPAARRRSLETLSHTALSVVDRRLAGVDAAIVFNAANAVALPVLRARRIPVATHVDGLEWQRAKWGGLGRRYYRTAEALAVRWSDALIADARGIADYYESEFGALTRQISYGAPILVDLPSDRLAELDLAPGGFYLIVARFEPENHVAELVAGHRLAAPERPLIVVGSAPYAAEYTRRVHAAADAAQVRFLGGVWDDALLNQLYAHCFTYLHGHSVGGTNPSLLRAAGAGAPVLAWDVPFNREVIGTAGRYAATPAAVADVLATEQQVPEGVARRGTEGRAAVRRYDWDTVAGEYQQLLADLIAGEVPALPSGRRRRSA